MSLLSELDGAELVIADKDLGLMFVWYGGAGVQILDEKGAVRDYFSIASGFDKKLTTQQVRKVIAAYRQELVHD